MAEQAGAVWEGVVQDVEQPLQRPAEVARAALAPRREIAVAEEDLLHERAEAGHEEAGAREGEGGGGERRRRGGAAEGVGGRGDQDARELEGERVLEEREAHVPVVHDAEERFPRLAPLLVFELHRRLPRARWASEFANMGGIMRKLECASR